MRVRRISIVLCLLLSLASCTRRSSNPQKDIIGTWRGAGIAGQVGSIVYLDLKDNGKCIVQESIFPDEYPCKYALNIDSSGEVSITITKPPLMFDTAPSSRTYPIDVYEDELVVGGASLKRASKSPPR